MLYLIVWATRSLTFSVMLSFFFLQCLYLLLPPMGCLYWQARYETPTIYFIVLISLLLWITHVCCRKCHRSVLYEITMQFTVCSFSSSFLSLSGLGCACFSLWCSHWKTLRHKFVLFFVLSKERRFFTECSRILFFFSVGRNNSCYVSNKW